MDAFQIDLQDFGSAEPVETESDRWAQGLDDYEGITAETAAALGI